MAQETVDAVVVGGGPNGLAAALVLARQGRSVTVLEAADSIGGGTRSAELTLPGFIHDVCSAIHPFGRTSPFFREVGLERHGLRWVDAPYSMAHPLDDGSAVLVERDVDATASRLGPDADAYRGLVGPIVRSWDRLVPEILGPFHIPLRPLSTIALARFGLVAIRSTTSLARRFRGEAARALLAGMGVHSILRLTEPISGAAALVMLGSAHADGWPFPQGGAGRIADALSEGLAANGVNIETGRRVDRIEQLPPHRAAFFDVTPRQLLTIAGDRFPGRYRSALGRYRYGPGVFKLDIALEGPVPWTAEGVAAAGTVHVGGSLEEIARAEAAVHAGREPERPFVLVAQQSLFDPTRAPKGGQTLWAYCHVPNGSTADMTEPILAQIERFAPGFRDRVLSTSARGPAVIEAYDANAVGGDIAGGRNDLGQLFTRPTLRLDPYSTPDPSIFICSASTPPGGGVHGMCGYHAARSAAKRLR